MDERFNERRRKTISIRSQVPHLMGIPNPHYFQVSFTADCHPIVILKQSTLQEVLKNVFISRLGGRARFAFELTTTPKSRVQKGPKVQIIKTIIKDNKG